jgi:hypothetical protein
MKQILYRGYRIVATAEKEGKAWRSYARVSLAQGRRTTRLQEHETLFDSKPDAEEHALRLGQHWVNSRLHEKRLRS